MNPSAFKFDATSKPAASLPVLEQAMVEQWQAGQYAACLTLAQQCAQDFPRAGLAWKLLGALYPLFDQPAQALEALLTAQKLLPKDAEILLNLGNAYAKAEQYAEAEQAYLKAIKLSPTFAQAHENLGSVLHLQHQLPAAQKALSKAIACQPNSARAQAELGLVLHEQGKAKQAMQYYRKALQLHPEDATSHYNLAQALEDVEDDVAAQASYASALAIQPDYIDALFNLGYLHKRHQRYEEANRCFTQILSIDPEHDRALQVLADSYLEKGEIHRFVATYLKAVGEGNAFSSEKMNDMVAMLLEKDLPNEAEQYCLLALEKEPDSPLILNNMGLICYARNDPHAAKTYFDRAIAAKPDFAPAYSNGALPLLRIGKLNEAIAYLHKAVELNPNYFAAYVNLGMAYSDFGDIPQAIAYLEKALEIKPDNGKPMQSILFLSAYHPDRINARYFELLSRFGEVAARKATPFQHWRIHRDDQRIRIGFVSGDLKHHPVGLFLKPVLAHLDQSRFDVFVYSNSVLEDKVTGELKSMVSGWRMISHLNDEMAARKIHEDGIHILIDLSGHTSLNRLPMFAWKPAPLQMTWLGYWASTGMPAIDYLIADEVSVPPSAHAQFSEKVAYLPDTRMCFSEPVHATSVAPLPALSNGYVTLGCYHKYTKATDEVIALWCAVLQQLPTAKLRWQTTAFGDAKMVDAAQARFAAHGISAERCQFLPAASVEVYLQSHAEVDFILDTFPFTGGTTTCDALWMGVPTLTIAGEHLIARQGASLLSAAGLSDWVVDSQAAFVHQAVAKAQDLASLSALRAALRPRLAQSALFNGQRFTAAFAQLLQETWASHRAPLTAEQYAAAQPLQCVTASTPSLRVVSATRLSEQAFWQQSALGISLRRQMQKDARIQACIAFENTRDLPEVFNQAIADAPEDALLMLVHDDVWLDEYALFEHVQQGLQQYDVLGVAGNQTRIERQPGWQWQDVLLTEAAEGDVLGSLAQGPHAFGRIHRYGEAHGDCQLLEGALLLTRKAVLTHAQLTFDPAFQFEMVAMDFCRSATAAGLKLGVWPLAMTHQSMGKQGSPVWYAALQQYLRKWEDPHAVVTAPVSAELKQAMDEVFELALAAHAQGDLTQAGQLYQEILKADPGHALALHNLALIEWQPEASSEILACALQRFEQAYRLAPAQWQLLSSYVSALAQCDHIEQASAVLAQATEHDAQQRAALANQLGLVLPDATQATLQSASVETKLAQPSVLPPMDVQQTLLQTLETQQYPALEAQLHTLLQQYPDWLEGWKMLSDCLMVQKKDACTAAERALALNAEDPREHCYYGLVLKAGGHLTEAALAFEHAVTLQPDYVSAWNNWGLVLKEIGQAEAAVSKFEQALTLQPAFAACFSNLLFCLSHVDGIAPDQLLDLHVAFAERYETPLKADWPVHDNLRDPARVLKVGFVSADFRAHSMAHFLLPVLPVLAQHPAIQLYAYANQTLRDDVTTEMQTHFAVWHSVADWSDAALATQIQQDGIDLLVDLSGHTAGNRLLTFARKPAPIQMSWLGYLHSTGLHGMDYYLTDALMGPADQLAAQFTEQLVQLPVFGCFTPHAAAPTVNELPAMRNGYLTFGCFNRPNKITAATVTCWAGLLNALPDSRLLLGGMHDLASCQHLLDQLQAAGVDRSRVELLAHCEIEAYLQYYHAVDICLDTQPSSGVTTTAHALWMGVPTLCLADGIVRGRGAAALMTHAGLSNWVVAHAEDWLTQGLRLCADLPSLAVVRANLRTQLQQCPLSQANRLADALVEAWQTMWQRWCAGEGAVSFQIVPEGTVTADEAALVPAQVPGPETVEARLMLANTLLAHGDVAGASELYQTIIAQDAGHAEAQHQLGFITAHTDSLEAALPHFEAAVTRGPQHEQYWVSYIDALAQLGDTQTARAALQHGQQFGLSVSYASTLLAEIEALEQKQLEKKALKQQMLRHGVLAAMDQPLQPTPRKTTLAVQKQLYKPVFYIHAPAYSNYSSGVRCLHNLCHTLNSMGYESYVTTDQVHPALNTPLVTLDLVRKHQHAQRLQIAIYSEVEMGNPLYVPHVVRYFLNHPNVFKQESWFGQFHPDEYVLNFPDFQLPWIASKALMVQSIDRRVYHRPAAEQAPRKGFLLYEHRVDVDLEIIPDWCKPDVVISSKNPRSPEQLAALYQQAEGLILFERSAAAPEALLCGCPVLFSDAYGLDKALTQSEDYKAFFSVWNFDRAAYQDLLQRVPTFELVFDGNPRHADAHIAEMAIDVIRHFSTQDTDMLAMTPAYQMMRANQALERVNEREAVLAYRQTIVDFPDFIEPYYQLAMLLKRVGCEEAAKTYYVQGLERLATLPEHSCLNGVRLAFATLGEELSTAVD